MTSRLPIVSCPWERLSSGCLQSSMMHYWRPSFPDSGDEPRASITSVRDFQELAGSGQGLCALCDSNSSYVVPHPDHSYVTQAASPKVLLLWAGSFIKKQAGGSTESPK